MSDNICERPFKLKKLVRLVIFTSINPLSLWVDTTPSMEKSNELEQPENEEEPSDWVVSASVILVNMEQFLNALAGIISPVMVTLRKVVGIL